ncbi:MAG: ribonuclease G [Gammaproteobacteria bacterium]|nr:ribonuclease G [Gammaproteobacteria bacterium]
MSEEILVNVTPRETRVAVVENGVLQEVHVERASRRGLVGNIYKGKVSRVLPGMQAAFINIGLERAAFLHASDIVPLVDEPNDAFAANHHAASEDITALLREGQDVLVQVIKDPLGTKGARLTTHITIPSRYLVFMPDSHHIGISQRIEEAGERERLKAIVSSFENIAEGGFIVRTNAEGVGETELRADADFLRKLWIAVRERIRVTPTCSVIHEDLSLPFRTLRDMVETVVEKIRVDSRETWGRMQAFAREFVPGVAERIEHYTGERPIFDLYGVEDEIQKALARKVLLKSGGYLILDQTEAMTTIDVNTGAFVGHRNLEETIFKTNLEAAGAIGRQLRLRNLGGIIIIDFIDMTDEEHKRQVLRTLEKTLERDHAKTQICEISPLGLVEMTRKRTRESLEHVLCEPCPACAGRGTVKTAETVCYEIFREILRANRAYPNVQTFLVLASQDVVDRLLDEESASVAELEVFIGKPVKFQVESLYSQEQFDVVLM